MSKWLVWFPLKVLDGAFALVGAAALVLTAMIATPLRAPPELTSISKSARAVDRSTMPPLSSAFPPATAPSWPTGIIRRGGLRPARSPFSCTAPSGSSVAVHALADALAARGVETYAPDIRGHGGSGTRGDIGYVGQLEDDMADFVAEVRKTEPGRSL